jgi:hypothetical protein
MNKKVKLISVVIATSLHSINAFVSANDVTVIPVEVMDDQLVVYYEL